MTLSLRLRAASAFFLLLALSGAGLSAEIQIQFLDHGKKKAEKTLKQMEKLVQPVMLKVYEPHENREVAYRAIPLRPLMEKLYGNVWGKAEEVLFTCSDGYQPSIPAEEFRRADAYLAFAKAGNAAFRLTNTLQNNERVELGPFYLIWDNLKNEALKAEGASTWPYQVTTIDLVDFSDRFARMTPPDGLSKKVKDGFLAYRKYCSNCHRINGDGGEKSIELNYPVSVTEYIRPAWLKKWIDNPSSMRFGTFMPPLNPALKDRKAVIDNIVAYLTAMQKKKMVPATKKP